MANTKIPDPLTRRHLLEKDLGKSALEIAEAYLEAGRKIEAIDFLVKAEAGDRLQALAEEAVEAGDTFMLQAISRATGEEMGQETWNRTAVAAKAAGLERYAKTAHRQARRESD